MDGFLVVDKPAGMTSHDVVARVRRILGQKKVGHTGTLDPFATGVLPIALGEGTKAIPFLDESRKEYRAVMRLGEATDTQDLTGQVVSHGDWCQLTPDRIEAVARLFVGAISQVPPMFSALKRNGVPLYKLARQGAEVERQPRDIEIFSLVLERIELPDVVFSVSCSRGTYVRTLAADIGERLGCGAHLRELRRTRSGPFVIADTVTLEQLAEAAASGKLDSLVVSPLAALSPLPEFPLTERGAAKIGNGIVPDGDDLETGRDVTLSGGRVRLSHGGRLVAVAEAAVADGGRHAQIQRLLRVFH
ncbi:tRNA pseudouridine(55) synthase TruB [Geobacter sp. AOG1]|uniref:tRNA pseudouridine(55) synthase TruB n=1 Tax=Geobacter sp. AOG1 TaxID=1566346 RepID=UPI001CC57AD8|nr:tRNA pseudouridine(55) synthase TruB [Geobacter sp. AOG1]